MATPKTRDRAATEARILTAAAELFAREGYDRVTVREIAAAADANPALISRYFGSKQELFLAMLATTFKPERLLEGSLADLPRRLADYCLRERSADDRTMMVAMNRSGSVPELRTALAERMDAKFVRPLADLLGGDTAARERALIVSALLSGVGQQRRNLGDAALPAGRQAEGGALGALTATFATALGLGS